MSWGEPRWWFALVGWVLLLVAMIAGAAWHRHTLRQAFGDTLLQQVHPWSVRIRRGISLVLWLFGLFWAIVALVEPRLNEKMIQIEQKGVDLVLLIDLSRSMDAQDVDPSRLERARREIDDFLELSQGDRVGVVIYAGAAFPRLPLTEDERIVSMVTHELDTSAFEAQGSELGEAIREALKLLGEPKDAGQGILIFSDGEAHRPDDALAAASAAKERNVRIYGVAIGEKLAPIPLPDGSYLTEGGAVVRTQPSMDVLKDVARVTGGAVVSSVASAEDMASLYDEIRAGMTAGDRGMAQKKISESAFQWPLGLAMMSWLLAAWLGEGLRVSRGIQFAGALLCLAWSTDGWSATLEEADRLFREGRFEESVEAFQDLTAQSPEDAAVWGRLAAARYRAGDTEGAARAWEEQDRLAGGDADAAFNAGNAHYRSHRLDRALELYQRALEIEPGHSGATKNDSLVRKELEARKQQPPPPKKQEEQPENGSGSGESGDPQPGQEGKQGEPKEDEQKPGDQGEQGESGEPGKSAPGTVEGSKDGMSGSDGGERQPGESQATSPGELNPDGPPGSPVEGGTEGTGEMSAGEAGKLIDGVKEGRPRVYVPGQGSGKPW